MSTVLPPRVTPRRRMPDALAPASMSAAQRRTVHMLASLLLDYPDTQRFERLDVFAANAATLPTTVAEPLQRFIDRARESGASDLQKRYVTTFDLKRKCSLYLSYFATGDTRRRGTALVTFLDAYRAAGWEFDADELPDYLPAVLEFSARSQSDVADALLAAHREGIEVLRAALEGMDSPWADIVRAVTLSLPKVDQATRERVLALVSEGPPTETVGLSLPMPAFRKTGE
ncbi:nitrate reductase molybdenum cofactor assembly chaperone [Microbacterium esteraromaticum]|uniref:nitrate reductase molybdenum cofactor assembly chaperone n=1 Tax=Microbacterium esteraromaticum TaxID=57043 RepID=UPI001C947109|nr:nitrate reductase molybdenum cofactor assembly chaperone [Microbacterium esteraromaticum]MBY6061409.1 nitrate reductase molybdenum cofactor assembly chaperone [Microbacterium esteraromaticum]